MWILIAHIQEYDLRVLRQMVFCVWKAHVEFLGFFSVAFFSNYKCDVDGS